MQLAIVLGVGLTVGALAMALRYFVQLAPERARLLSLLRQYDEAAG